MANDWISVKEAAALYGLAEGTFRRNYCDPGGILQRLRALRVRRGPSGRRRLFVLRQVIEQLIEDERGEGG